MMSDFCIFGELMFTNEWFYVLDVPLLVLKLGSRCKGKVNDVNEKVV